MDDASLVETVKRQKNFNKNLHDFAFTQRYFVLKTHVSLEIAFAAEFRYQVQVRPLHKGPMIFKDELVIDLAENIHLSWNIATGGCEHRYLFKDVNTEVA